MIEITCMIEGMQCSMCESHINDVIRKNFKVKKVHSSSKKNQTVIISAVDISDEQLRHAIDPTGYRLGAITRKEAVRKGLFF